MGCKRDAKYRYTWPGNDESFICERHSLKMAVVARAMGLHLQLIPLDEGQPETCTQKGES